MTKQELLVSMQRLSKLENKLEKAFIRYERLKMLRLSNPRQSAFFKAEDVVNDRRNVSRSPATEELQIYINEYNRTKIDQTSYYTAQAQHTQTFRTLPDHLDNTP